jgi:pimeloyl-ACP methyl ester carboxylesterase
MKRRTLMMSAAGALLVASRMPPAEAASASTPPASSPSGSPSGSIAGSQPWTRRGTIQRPGGVMGYAMAGQGPVLVLLPKLGGWIDDWSPLARELAADFTLIAIDPPGHGSSRFASEPPAVQTLSESAAMIRATLEELGVESFALAGNSLGGCISATMAALWPKTVTRLVLVSTAVYPKDSMAQILEDEAKANPRNYEADGSPVPRTRERAMATFGMNAAFTDEMSRSRAAAGKWIRASERGVRREGIAELLPRIAAPTLLVYSDRGTYLRHRITAERLIRHAKLATITDAGAFVHQEKPVETARAIREFLRA